jgi:hypothetical protein
MKASPILKPALALIIWTQVVLVWLYIRRIPEYEKLRKQGKYHPEKPAVAPKTEIQALTAPAVRWVADNYNHLVEHPTLFYALLFYIECTQQSTSTLVNLAWSYVALRVAHTYVQCCSNIVLIRFAIFILSALIFAVMTGLVVKEELQ